MTTAILIIVILILIGQTINYVALINAVIRSEDEMKRYYDRETMRILTAMYNKDAFIDALNRGEEVEL